MDKLVCIENVSWIKEKNITETYIADTIPSISECASVYSLVFKDGLFLQTELRKGERPTQRLDIPGGHVDEGEALEQAVVRETFEETGVIVKVRKFIAYKKIKLLGQKPENYSYPYPVSYMGFYICDVIEETPFDGNEDTLGRVWLSPEDFKDSVWCVENRILLDEVMKYI